MLIPPIMLLVVYVCPTDTSLCRVDVITPLPTTECARRVEAITDSSFRISKRDDLVIVYCTNPKTDMNIPPLRVNPKRRPKEPTPLPIEREA